MFCALFPKSLIGSLAESGQLPLEMVPVGLKALVAETLQALEPLAAKKCQFRG